MNPDHQECLDKHERIQTLEEVVFGNPRIGEKGMKQKVDEMHEILVQFKGLKGFFGGIVLVGAVLVALKTWIFK